jgi:hypothetical protein
MSSMYLDLLIHESSLEMEAPRISLLVLRWYLDYILAAARGPGAMEAEKIKQ